MTMGALGVHASFASTAESIAAARRLIRKTLAEWPVGEVADDALLVVSELCTNAVIHAGTGFTVSCTHLGTAIRLAVRDSYPGRGLPNALIEPGSQRTSGRGLLLCAALSSAWGVEYDGTGKVVWCHLDVPGAVADRPPGVLAAVTLDSAGAIRDWTAAAGDLLGWPAGDVLGRRFADLAEDRRSSGGTVEPTWAGAADLLVLHHDGHRVPVHARFLPVGAATPAMVLLAPEEYRDAFDLPATPAPAEEVRHGEAPSVLDSERLPAHELPQRAAEACCDYLGGDAAYLMLVDDNGELRVAGSTGLAEGAGAYVEQTDDVLRSSPERLPQVVEDLADAPQVPAPLAEAGMRSAVSVPVLTDGRLTGLLTVASATPGRFSHDDAVRLHLAAAQLARPLDRARITELERRRRGWLSYLAEASDLLAGTLEPQATVAVLAQLVVPRLATWCAVHMVDERGRPRLAHVWHADESLLDAVRVLLDQTPPPMPTDAAATPWATLADPGAGMDMSEVRPADVDRIRTGPMVTFALTARGRTLGVVVLGREPGERFGRDVLGLSEEICRRAALVLDNALLYSDHLATSHALQASLLPARLPQVDQLDVGVAYQAKGEGHDVGGDFYDLYAVGPNTWRFTIGDVCGSGPAAAAITGLARNALRILGRHGLPLTEVLTQLNALILDESVGSRFLTALHGEIVPQAGGGVRLSLVTAGHPTPYLLDGADPARPVCTPQPLLGVLPQVTYEAEEMTLEPGQLLVCMTDGVLERRNGSRMLGEHDLAEVLARCAGVSAGAAAAQVQQAVLEYSPEPSRDDFAILVLRAT
jgi:serine phosphatase RsbU (regulator of sigma subunit)/anti-sigma regulatory factor (Ser/Thr protein kinase)